MRISSANLYSALYGLSRIQGRGNNSAGYSSSLGGVYNNYQNLYRTSAYKLQKEAVGFRSIAEKLQDTDWEKEYKFSEKKALQNGVRTFVEEFNQLYSQVKNIQGSKDGSYGAQFQELVYDNKEKLSKIGVEIGQNGTLSVNNSRLKKAKAVDFKEVFSGPDSLAGKAAVKSIYAEARALAGVSTYGAGISGYGMYGYGAYGTAGLSSLHGVYHYTGGYPYTGSFFDMLL